MAITTLMTSLGQLSRFVANGNYATWSEHLLGNHNIVVVVFYPTAEPWFRHDEGSWPAKAFHASRCQAPHDGVPGTSCAKWVNWRGQIVLTCPVEMRVPVLYKNNLMASRGVKLPTFCGRGLFSGEYVVGTKHVRTASNNARRWKRLISCRV